MKRVWTLASPGCTIALSSPATRSLGFSGGDEENPHCRVKTLHFTLANINQGRVCFRHF